jgi:hypothetical protein
MKVDPAIAGGIARKLEGLDSQQREDRLQRLEEGLMRLEVGNMQLLAAVQELVRALTRSAEDGSK